MRLSQENEDCQRASNYQSSPSDRSQTAVRLACPFPKKARLRTRQEFRKLQKEGLRIQGSFLTFCIASENFTHHRLGITVSKKFGAATLRNLFKRRIREVFRQVCSELPLGTAVHVAPRAGAQMPTFAQVQQDFQHLIDNRPLA